jgi:putative ABC transport system permease protein
MISLVMFALVVMSTMNSNFNRILSGDEARGGYDLIVQESPSNHIGDLKAVLAAAGGDGGAAAQQVDAQAEVQVANGRVSEVRNAPRPGDDPTKVDWSKYTVAAPTDSFIDTNAVSLQGRAEGYATDADVWRALATRPDLAVVDDNAVSGGGFGGGSFQLEGVKQGQATFKPLPIQVRDASAPDKVKDVRVIGIISPKASALFGRLYLSQTTFAELFPRPDASVYYVRLQPGADATAAARAIERTLSARGVQADSLRKLISDFQAQSRGFSYLIQGFMGIGLFVGIAAVGVIAFRTVVERRQQIGMLRAIGYTRRAVAISFILESSFVALLGVLSGVVLGLLLTWELLGSEEFANAGITGFHVPWLEIIGIAAFAFLASLVMTIIPSRQASSIPIAEALRYE